MGLYHTFKSVDGSCLTAIWKIEENEETLAARLPDGCRLLAEARCRFKASSRRLEWLAVRRLLHEVGCNSPIAYYPTGRPYLADDNRHISISHTRGYAAVAVHQRIPVGLDIEQRTDKVCRVKDKFLSDEEKSFLPSEKNNVEAMLVIWTAKEAMFKLIDREGIDFAGHLHVSPFVPAAEGTVQAYETFTGEGETFEFVYQTFPDFVLSLCTNTRPLFRATSSK